MIPLPKEVADRCTKEMVGIRDAIAKTASEVTDDPLRQASVAVTMLEQLMTEILIMVGHDNEGCRRALLHITSDVVDILDQHFAMVKGGH